MMGTRWFFPFFCPAEKGWGLGLTRPQPGSQYAFTNSKTVGNSLIILGLIIPWKAIKLIE